MKYFLFITLAVVISTATFLFVSQQSVAKVKLTEDPIYSLGGLVTDKNTNEILKNFPVKTYDGQRWHYTETNTLGWYSFESDLPQGTYTVIAHGPDPNNSCDEPQWYGGLASDVEYYCGNPPCAIRADIEVECMENSPL